MDHKSIVKKFRYRGINLKHINKSLCIRLYNFMQRLRICEEELEREYHPKDQMRCPVHFCSGQEAVPASLSILMKKNDYLFSHHRSHGYYLSKNAPMKKLFAEIYGKETGANSGIAGSQDISYPEEKFFSGAILAGAAAIAVGAAISLSKNTNKNNIVITGFGESATDQGIFWESLNYASLKKLPIIFICENNNYATYSPQHERQSGYSIAKKAKAFGVDSSSVFGNDIAEVFTTLKKAISNVRKKKGPYLLEAFTYRYSGHVGPFTDDYQDYRSKNEIDFWKKIDPIKILKKELYKKKFLNDRSDKLIINKIHKEIRQSFNFAKKSNFPKFKSWEDLNVSKKKSLADKILKNIKQKQFDKTQKVVQAKGY